MASDAFNEAMYLLANPDVAFAVGKGEFATGQEHYERHGLREGRGWVVMNPYSREQMVLENLKLDGKGLEIGPSHNPITPKRKGFDVDIVDHIDAKALKQKYADHNVDLEKIEEVDFVWNGELLSELIGKIDHYDWIIASHVIEHIPDPITFLQQCERLLKPNGKLALVIPDKRYCFDYFQPITFAGPLLDAFHDKRKRPTPGQVFDHLSNACALDQKAAWGSTDSGSIDLLHTLETGVAVWRQATEGSDYFDVHCWRFTRASFRMILSDLNSLGLIALCADSDHETVGSEFYVVLRKSREASTPIDRLAILKEIVS